MNNMDYFSILIVAKSPQTIDLLRQHLYSKTYQIHTLTNTQKLPNLLTNIPIDLILLELDDSEESGFLTCQLVKEEPSTRHIPVIFVSGDINTETLRYCFSIGAADLILAPILKDVVNERVTNQLLHTRQMKLDRRLQDSNKLAELGSMVAEITHEVASPLSNLRLSIDYIIEQNTRLKSEFDDLKLSKNALESYIDKFEKALKMSLANINLASNIVLSFKQVAVDQCTNSLLTFNLNHYLKDILLTLRPKLKKHAHQVTLNIDEKININSYPGVFSQIFINLINNSILHAFEHNSVGEIVISSHYEEDTVTIIYQDDGIGMDILTQKNAFNKFYTTKAGKGGSGLGLAICKELIEDVLHGSISLQSQLGFGTTFTILLDKDLANKK
jgi:signal transduction histidine kinase